MRSLPVHLFFSGVETARVLRDELNRDFNGATGTRSATVAIDVNPLGEMKDDIIPHPDLGEMKAHSDSKNEIGILKDKQISMKSTDQSSTETPIWEEGVQFIEKLRTDAFNEAGREPRYIVDLGGTGVPVPNVGEGRGMIHWLITKPDEIYPPEPPRGFHNYAACSNYPDPSWRIGMTYGDESAKRCLGIDPKTDKTGVIVERLFNKTALPSDAASSQRVSSSELETSQKGALASSDLTFKSNNTATKFSSLIEDSSKEEASKIVTKTKSGTAKMKTKNDWTPTGLEIIDQVKNHEMQTTYVVDLGEYNIDGEKISDRNRGYIYWIDPELRRHAIQEKRADEAAIQNLHAILNAKHNGNSASLKTPVPTEDCGERCTLIACAPPSGIHLYAGCKNNVDESWRTGRIYNEAAAHCIVASTMEYSKEMLDQATEEADQRAEEEACNRDPKCYMKSIQER